MFTKVERCRICGNSDLPVVVDLGDQMLTGVFPKTKEDRTTIGPLHLVRCRGGSEVCGLLQLGHTYDLDEMYGDNYGYRSGLNAGMVAHLHGKVGRILQNVTLDEADLVLDVGSNDSTTLQAYPPGPTLLGFDPTGVKFRKYYPAHIELIADFFSSRLLAERYPGQRARIITSFSMFYDLPDPQGFMQEVFDVLADDGVWVFEQSYMPTMLETNAYDTICHEHLEFYAMHQVKWMTDRVGFRIVDVELNNVNGGSFSVTAVKAHGNTRVAPVVQALLDDEVRKGLNTAAPYDAFARRVETSRNELREFFDVAKREGRTVMALGASTKGNVLLQYCGVTDADVEFIGEVNSDKFGSYTPGTWIPIVSENDVLLRDPDYLIVLPWHFRDFFEENPRFKDFCLVFPLPTLSASRRHVSG